MTPYVVKKSSGCAHAGAVHCYQVVAVGREPTIAEEANGLVCGWDHFDTNEFTIGEHVMLSSYQNEIVTSLEPENWCQ